MAPAYSVEAQSSELFDIILLVYLTFPRKEWKSLNAQPFLALSIDKQ